MAAGNSTSAAVAQGKAYPERMKKVMDYFDHQHKPKLVHDSTHMFYDRDLNDSWLPEVVRGLQPQDCVPPGAKESDHARVICALLYLACGGLDQAHNLVTPLSWGSPTSFGGPPIPNSPAAQDASYVHALVHRAEGNAEGEFGSGFSNAGFWFRAMGKHEIQPLLLQSMAELADSHDQLKQHVALHGAAFDPSEFVSLCSKAVRRGADPALLAFCEAVAEREWRLLLECSMRKAQQAQ